MLNYLWAGMIIIGVVYSMFTGQMAEVTTAALDSAKEAVSLCITMVGVMAFWVGMMEIAKESGMIEAAKKKLEPSIRFLFPNIPREHPANEQIAVNLIANILGLGWAATPAGLWAMSELENLENDRRKRRVSNIPIGTASNEMCDFLILNISSLQLIPVNVIVYRSQYGSVNPTAVIAPGILATLISTGVAILFIKIRGRWVR